MSEENLQFAILLVITTPVFKATYCSVVLVQMKQYGIMLSVEYFVHEESCQKFVLKLAFYCTFVISKKD